ncbi:MAG: acyl--CoA ligase [Clostridia bacterium]|nr:acyl--CoA ligase [Clostridia bacterium]
MENLEKNSAYRDFRICAYRNKYEPALIFGGKTLSFGMLLSRAEYAYNTFCQMGIDPGDRVCLWLPNCPDLLASFYGLSRLGAIAVLIHPSDTPREVRRQMRSADAGLLITTPGRYDDFCREGEPLLPGQVVLCRPESDMKGPDRRVYLAAERPEEEEVKGYLLEDLMAENRYNALETPFGDKDQAAVVLSGTTGFIRPNFILYLPEELTDTVAEFWRRREPVHTVYVENSFATEGGFLAAHGALSTGRTLIWSVGEPYELLKKRKPDLLIATEEFFWEFRQRTEFFGKKWENLQGGIQLGKELTPLMEKFAGRAIAAVGGMGGLCGSPVPLKVRREELYFVKDFGVRLADMEQELSRLSGIAKCKCTADGGGIRLRVLPDGKEPVSTLGRALVTCCKREMNPLHLPRSVEFCSVL